MKTFTRVELARYDGQEGRPAYIAYRGRVIDVTDSRMWRGGSHMKRHDAGQDLSDEIVNAPHDVDVLDRFPQVGVLVEEPAAAAHAPHAARSLPAFLSRFLDRHPFFLRHPHPMTVHFPIVFFIAVPVFTALFLLTGRKAFESTAVQCMGAALLSSLVVIPTGLFTWWVNYGAQPIRAVTIKLVLSIVQFFVGLSAFLWRILEPGIVQHGDLQAVLYFLLVLAPSPMVFLVGWYGATLTFPLRRDKRDWRRR